MILALALINVSVAGSGVTTSTFVKKAEATWPTTHKDFVTTRSPCLDALLLNFKAAGCRGYDLDRSTPIPDGVGFSCKDPKILNGWTLNEHVIAHTLPEMEVEFKGWDVFCFDPNVIVFIMENPKFADSAK